jgi:hypothetical protein
MRKQVRYAIGAIGVAPALGLMMPAATAAAATHAAPAKTGKTVSARHYAAAATPAATCSGVNKHMTSFSGVMLKFWSAADGSDTCVGTIDVSVGLEFLKVHTTGTSVINNNGRFCTYFRSGDKGSFTCRHAFDRAGLRVRGYGSAPTAEGGFSVWSANYGL